MWIDVGMQVPGRDDLAHIAIFDHPDNAGYPQAWRVDDQLGVGPARSRTGDWTIARNQTEVIRHRLLVYTGGPLNDIEMTDGVEGRSRNNATTTALWGIAQREGREAKFLTPEQAVAQMTTLDGYHVNAWAAEPMVAQPMAFCWDDRGRLWVAENRDYESRVGGFSNPGRQPHPDPRGHRSRRRRRQPEGVHRRHHLSRRDRRRLRRRVRRRAAQPAVRAGSQRRRQGGHAPTSRCG